MSNAMDADAIKVPVTIGMDTSGLEPLLRKWRKAHVGVPWSELVRRGLKKELKSLAGKRHAHLVEDYQP